MSRPPRLLAIAFLAGLTAFVLAWVGFGEVEGMGWVERAFTAADVLTFGMHDAAPAASGWLDGARLFALLGGLATVLGVAYEISPGVRVWFRRVALRGRMEPVVVIGLGWVGGALAAEVRREHRAVYALALDPSGPRAQAASRLGVLVEEGDATTEEGLDRLPLARAAEVFIATGDDVRNLEIAGAIKKRQDAVETERRVYVHVGDPSVGVTVAQREVLPSERVGDTWYRVFSVHENAAGSVVARIHRSASWADDEAVHVVLVGFGNLGRTLALRCARGLHGTNRRRLRMTVLHSPAERDAVARFRALHPGFAPAPGFSLDAWDPLQDFWHARAARPEATAWRTRDHDPHAVEVAVLAEFVETATPVSPDVTALLLERFRTRNGVSVQPAVVVATDDEGLNARYAVGLQDALATERGWPADPTRRGDGTLDLAVLAPPTDGLPAQVAIYPFLFDESGLAALVKPEPTEDELPTSRADWFAYHIGITYPVRPFGYRGESASYAVVTGRQEQEDARRLHEMYRLLSDTPEAPIPSAFETSNLDAVALAYLTLERYFLAVPRRLSLQEATELDVIWQPTLGLEDPVMFDPDEAVGGEANSPSQLPSGQRQSFPVLEPAMRPYEWLGVVARASETADLEVLRALEGKWAHRLHPYLRAHPTETTAKAVCRQQRIQEVACWAQRCVERDLRYRAMVGEQKRYAPFVEATQTRKVLRAFKGELDEVCCGLADRLAEMEHNRWMAERLVFGWRAGTRSYMGRRRDTFRVWERLSDEERLYDRAHLPRLIIERMARLGERRTGTLYYLRRSAETFTEGIDLSAQPMFTGD